MILPMSRAGKTNAESFGETAMVIVSCNVASNWFSLVLQAHLRVKVLRKWMTCMCVQGLGGVGEAGREGEGGDKGKGGDAPTVYPAPPRLGKHPHQRADPSAARGDPDEGLSAPSLECHYYNGQMVFYVRRAPPKSAYAMCVCTKTTMACR
jgi:hypothetical protein